MVMAKKPRFALIYADAVKKHLLAIERKYHRAIRLELEAQLSFEPESETRNRKPLRRPMITGAKWELRMGPDNRFRAFYEVNPDAFEVQILAIGIKEKNRLMIGGKEVE
jgi:hypothetical protein